MRKKFRRIRGWSVRINKKILKKNKFFLSKKYRIDVFGNILRLKQVTHKSFALVYYKFYNKLIRKSVNNSRISVYTVKKRRLSRKWRHVMHRRKKLIFGFYQNMRIHQIRALYVNCLKLRGNFISNFITKLELRLDMFLYRAFNLLSLTQIKQLITHKKIFVNSKIIPFPNYTLKKFDIVSFFGFENNNVTNQYEIITWIKEESKFIGSFYHKGRYSGRLMNEHYHMPWQTFIYIYNYFLAKIKKKNRRYLLHKHPKYIEVFYPLLIATCIEDILDFKEVPYFFGINKNNIINLFQL